MPVIALPGKVSLRMAVHAAWAPQNGNERDEKRSIATGRGGKGLGRGGRLGRSY
jgi:hypothetical protein